MNHALAIEEVLANQAEEAQILRRRGHVLQAETMESVLEAIRRSEPMGALLDWLNEEKARLWSGWGPDRLRAAFPQLQAQGLARLDGEGRRARRLYRRIGLPHRARAAAAFEAGRRGRRMAS